MNSTLNIEAIEDTSHVLSIKDKKKLIISAIGVLAVTMVSYFSYQSFMYVSTDNAMVEAKATFLSPRVGGIIIQANIDENQNVKAGQILAKIRPNEYQNALDQAESDRNSLAAQVKGAKLSYYRAMGLFKQGAATQEKLDSTEAQYQSLAGKLKSAESQVEQARLNLADTELKAPADGRIAKKSFEIGMMAIAGQPLLGFVAGDERWVTANFKETEMKGIEPGKPATIKVDAISGRKFEGVVESLSPSTGATFSLLPPDNATGNFTKVVQRVPARIKLIHLTPEDVLLLQTGLSAEVSVKLN